MFVGGEAIDAKLHVIVAVAILETILLAITQPLEHIGMVEADRDGVMAVAGGQEVHLAERAVPQIVDKVVNRAVVDIETAERIDTEVDMASRIA